MTDNLSRTCNFCGAPSVAVHWVQGIIDSDTKVWSELSVCDNCILDKDIRKLILVLMKRVSPLNWKIHYGRASEVTISYHKLLLEKCGYNFKGKKFNLEVEKECEHGTDVTKRNTNKTRVGIFIQRV